MGRIGRICVVVSSAFIYEGEIRAGNLQWLDHVEVLGISYKPCNYILYIALQCIKDPCSVMVL